MTVIRLLILVTVSGLLAGCGREEKAPPLDVSASNVPASPRGPIGKIEGEAQAPLIADSGDINDTLQKLTSALRDYVVRTHSVPKNFDDFATNSKARFPEPPAGKKYAIKGQEVVLVKR